MATQITVLQSHLTVAAHNGSIGALLTVSTLNNGSHCEPPSNLYAASSETRNKLYYFITPRISPQGI